MATENLLDHLKDDTIWKAIAAVIGSLFAGFVGLVRIIYNRDKKAIAFLYQWKDEKVDPHIQTIPLEYVRAPYCNRKHDEMLASAKDRHEETLAEMRHIRGILEKHLINGGPTAG